MSKDYIGKICPSCNKPLLEGEKVAICNACEVPQHLSCWQKSRGCATPGCTGRIGEVIEGGDVTLTSAAKPLVEPAPAVEKITAPAEKATPAEEKTSFSAEETAPVVEKPHGETPSIEEFIIPADPFIPEQSERSFKEPEQKVKTAKKPKKKGSAKRTFVLVISLIIVATISFGVVFYGIPYYRYWSACISLDKGEYEAAREVFLDLDDFLDSEDMAEKCLYNKGKDLLKEGKFDEAVKVFEKSDYNGSEKQILEAKYLEACDLLEKEKYTEAISAFEKIIDYKDSADMLSEIEYRKACDYLENGRYSEAISAFERIYGYKDSADKINEVKYEYVLGHRNNDDMTTYYYLLSLKDLDYMDSYYIYDELYSWKITINGWNSSQSRGQYTSHISKYDPVFCHFTVTGGIPGETNWVRTSSILPSGQKVSYDFDRGSVDGWQGWYGWSNGIYSNPQYGATGTLTVSFYDTYGNFMGSSYVEITG